MKKLFLVFLLYILGISICHSDIIIPDKNLNPSDVIRIQLRALQNNDDPYKDAGIEQTWNFAHPRNKSLTGPLPRFKAMLYDPIYNILLYHTSHELKLVERKDNMEIYAVSVLSKNNKNYIYIWIVQKVRNGKFKDCWLTTSVSSPQYDGDSI